MFTINELALPTSLNRCLGSTNIIESCFSGARGRTRRVSNWQDGSMVRRWAASALLATEKKFRRVLGYEALPILEAKLSELAQGKEIVRERRSARVTMLEPPPYLQLAPGHHRRHVRLRRLRATACCFSRLGHAAQRRR